MPKRDFKAEYARRIARGETRGLSRSQARGHAKPAEAHLRTPRSPLSDDRLQAALRVLRKNRNLALAAKSVRISPERLRRVALEKGIIQKEGRIWRLRPALARRMPLLSRGRFGTVTVTAEHATEVGRFMSAVGRFLETNKVSLLKPFEGHGVRDIAGKFHPFETNPNSLYRIGAGGESSFEDIYRIVV